MNIQFDEALLRSLTLTLLDATPASLSFRPVTTGKHNASFWVTGNKGKFVLRIAPADDAGFLFYERLMMRQEPALHNFIRARTEIPIAEIVGYNFDRTLIDRDFMLMVALPGQPISDIPNLTEDQFNAAMAQVGQHLRQLHRLTAPDCLNKAEYGYIGQHHPMTPQTTWVDAFTKMWHKLLDDVVACGAYSIEEGQTMRNLLEIHLAQFERPVPSALLHMDVWSQNILVDEKGNVTGLVDFDRALWGDVEIEFAVLDYCGISVSAFWEGYGIARDESASALIRRQFYLLYEIQKYMPIEVWRRNNMGKAQTYKQQCFEMAAQLVPQ